MRGSRGSWALLAAGLAWPYFVVTALTTSYALGSFGGMTLRLPDPPWWSAGAALTMLLGLIPFGVAARRLRRSLLWVVMCVFLDALGLTLCMTLLNVALSLPLA